MESEKRKRGDHGRVDAERAKGGKDMNGGESKLTEEEVDLEVEEFFAILKRIHVAVKYFEKIKGAGRKMTGSQWRPSFLLEDFEGQNDVKIEGRREDSEGNSGLDLNLDPSVSKEEN